MKKDYPNKIIFLEILKPERLVYKHEDDMDIDPESFRVTVDFMKENGKTRLNMHMLFDTAEHLERVIREFGAIDGAQQTLGRLEELLATLHQPGAVVSMAKWLLQKRNDASAACDEVGLYIISV